MLVRVAAVVAGMLVSLPAPAQELTAEQARSFVAGKYFAYTCFEGTSGVGRIQADGSVAGSVQFQGKGPVRHAALPAGTLKVQSGSVCASVKGIPFEPCFNVRKLDERSFRGSLAGFGFAYCDFTRRSARVHVASSRPRVLRSAVATTTTRTD